MRKITVTRDGGFYGKIRKLTLLVDGKKVGSILQKSSIELEIADDAKTLKGKMDWAKTSALDVSNLQTGDTVDISAYFTLNLLRSLGIMPLPFTFSVRKKQG